MPFMTENQSVYHIIMLILGFIFFWVVECNWPKALLLVCPEYTRFLRLGTTTKNLKWESINEQPLWRRADNIVKYSPIFPGHPCLTFEDIILTKFKWEPFIRLTCYAFVATLWCKVQNLNTMYKLLNLISWYTYFHVMHMRQLNLSSLVGYSILLILTKSILYLYSSLHYLERVVLQDNYNKFLQLNTVTLMSRPYISISNIQFKLF